MDFTERSTRTYRTKQLFTKEELAEIESRCVHEELPYCSAACPMKLDVRGFAALVAEGRLAEARDMLEHCTPFPRILAAGCSAPCQGVCRLNEAGEGLNISAMERAVLRLAPPKTGRGLLKFKKKKTAAVFGASLFTLALAGELAGKSYPTKFFAAEKNAAELIANAAPFLSPEDAAYELASFEKMDIETVYCCEITPEFLAETAPGFDLACAREGLSTERPDPVTLVTGSRVITREYDEEKNVMRALYDARRAGVSADRLCQGMDPSVMRGGEGAVETKLYTNMQGVEPGARIPEGGGYSPETLRAEAARCIQCACTECIKGCAYLRHFDKFPRILTREIYNNTGIIMGDHMMNRAMNSCALCSQCSVLCPNGYDMGQVCLRARENMVETDKLSLAVHEFALRDLLFSNGEAFLSRTQPGLNTCKYVFFPGCQAGAVAPETVYSAYLDLKERLPGGVSIMLGCCGAVAKWSGRTELWKEEKEFLSEELHKLSDPIVIAACPTCKKTLSEFYGGEIIGVWDVLNDLGLPGGAEKFEGRALMRDACGARGDAGTQMAVRKIAGSLGAKIVEGEMSLDKAACCGYGGLVSYTNPQLSDEFAADCVKNDPDAVYLSYCMACRDRLARQGAKSVHILELVYGAPAPEPGDISQRRHNRLNLRQRLLREIWGEDIMEEKRDFDLHISDRARKLMDERMILDTDVLAVMENYRRTGEGVFDEETGLISSSCRLGNVTIWVKFTETTAGYSVQSAYSHRMTIETR